MKETRVEGNCDLCQGEGGELVWSDARCRVVLVADASYPGYCRVVWNTHVPEFSDLAADERRHLTDVVAAVEAAVRQVQRPDKVNLASLGNMTPHLHWHVIPRWRDDPCYPQAIWAAPVRDADGVARPEADGSLRAAIRRSLDDLAAQVATP